MNRHLRAIPLATLVLVCLASVSLAQVRDNTGMFSSQAMQQANADIEQIRRQYGKDVVVEVFGQIPQEMRDEYQTVGQQQFFNAWMRQRARELGVNGVYVLVCRNPSFLEVGVGQETAKGAFTTQDRNQLASLMLGQFRNGQFDQGLVSGVDFVQQKMQANVGRSGGQPQYLYQSPGESGQTRTGGRSWLWIGLLVLGVLAVIWMMRKRRAAAHPAYGGGAGGYQGPGGYASRGYGGYPQQGGYGYPPQQGGGMGRGLLGGLLGGAAGGWLYDRFRGQGSQSQSQGGQAPPPPSSASDQGQGFSGAGGSFENPAPPPPEYGGGGDYGNQDQGGSGSSGTF